MKKIAYYTPSDDASSFYRCQGVMPFIHHEDFVLHDVSDKIRGSWADSIGYDTLILTRPFSEQNLAVIEQAQMMGVKVICDFDDLLTAVPEHNPAYDLYQENKHNVVDCIRRADEVWVSTEFIKQEFKRYNSNIYVIPNALNDYLYPVDKKLPFNGDNKIVFYRGGSTHRLDLYDVAEKIAEIASKNKDWTFFFMGCDTMHEFRQLNTNYKNVFVSNKVPILHYYQHLQQTNPAIMICPLQDHKLNRAKSNISLIESVYAGAAFIGQKNLPQFDHDFILDINHFDFMHFAEYTNPKRLKQYNENAWEYIKSNLLLSEVNNLRIDRLLK